MEWTVASEGPSRESIQHSFAEENLYFQERGESEGGEMVRDSLPPEGGGFHFFHFLTTFPTLCRICFSMCESMYRKRCLKSVKK